MHSGILQVLKVITYIVPSVFSNNQLKLFTFRLFIKDLDESGRRISRLPYYLTIHFVRNRWKETTKVNAKILRKVRFTLDLDVTDFCTDELKAKLTPVKDQLIEYEKHKAEVKVG